MTYTDGESLTADTPEELHDFAKSIRLNSGWYSKGMYDFWNDSFFELAIEKGAIKVSKKSLLELSKNSHSGNSETVSLT